MSVLTCAVLRVHCCRVVTPASGTCQVPVAMYRQHRLAAMAGQHQQQAAAGLWQGSHTLELMGQVGRSCGSDGELGQPGSMRVGSICAVMPEVT